MTLYLSQRVGKNLKNLIRNSKYRTQENFAFIMNVDPTTVRIWLSSGVKDINTIEEIAIKLEIDFMELLK